jgi:Flagellar GTP-binding protein
VLHDAPEETASLSAQHDALRASEIVALFKDELDVLKREIQETRKASAWHMQVTQPNHLSIWQRGLMDHPMPSRLRTLLIDALAGIDDDDEAEAHLHALLSEGLDQVTEAPEDITGVHAFFGPTGSGKTTVVGKLAKMAVERLGGDRIAIISFNDQKLGAWNQMQLMASQLGVACYRANSGDALQTVLREVADLGCVLIDTSGVDLTRQYETIETFAPEALTHLVVPSEIARATAHRVFESSMTWDSVNISKLDESTDNWVLLDALSSHDDRRVWLSSMEPV